MMTIAEIQAYLPHRYPFLMLDRILDVQAGERITALKNVSINEEFFNGHFPGNPVMPGVLVTEAMAQAAGILGFVTMNAKPESGKTYMYVGSDNLRFRKPVVPGDHLILEASLIGNRRGIWKFNGEARVDDQLVASGILICAEG